MLALEVRLQLLELLGVNFEPVLSLGGAVTLPLHRALLTILT